MSKKDKNKKKKQDDIFENKPVSEEKEDVDETKEDEDLDITESEVEEAKVVVNTISSKQMLDAISKSSEYKVEKTDGGYGVFKTNDELIREYLEEDVDDPKSAAISFCFKLIKKLQESRVIPVVIK